MSTDSFVNEMLAQGARLQEAREAESKALAALTGMLRDSIAEEHGNRARIQLESMIAENVQAAVDGTVTTSYFTLLSMLERAYRTGVSQGRIGEPGLAERDKTDGKPPSGG